MIATVTQAEANLLTLARTAVGLVPAVDVIRLLAASVPPPAKLGPTARRVLSETLARGTTLTLARGGGWQLEAGGRLWDRYPAPAFEFTGNIIRFFQWMLRTPMADPSAGVALQVDFTLAESIIATSLLDRLRGTGCEGSLARLPSVRNSPLAVLTHPVELARWGPLPVPPFDPDVLGVAIDGLRAVLVRSWVAGEAAKREITEPAVLARIGSVQDLVLDGFLRAIDPMKRSLATFLVDAGAEWLRTPRTPDDLVRGLSTDAPLRERAEARKRAAAFAHALARLRAWDQEHRSTRFIDDGYATAQALVRRWEHLTDAAYNAAAQLASALEALPQ